MYVPNCYRTCICYRHSVYTANVCTKLLQNMYLLQTQCVYCKCMYQTVTEHVFVTDTVCILQMYVPNCYRTCICYRHSVYSANVCTKLLQNMYLLQTQCVYCKCMYQTVTEHVFVTDTVCALQMYLPNCYRTCICYRHSVCTATELAEDSRNLSPAQLWADQVKHAMCEESRVPPGTHTECHRWLVQNIRGWKRNPGHQLTRVTQVFYW